MFQQFSWPINTDFVSLLYRYIFVGKRLLPIEMSSTARLLHKSLFRWMSSIVITCQINSHGNKISGLGFLHNVKRRSSLYCERETWCIEAYERTKSQKRRVHTPTVFKGCRQVYTVAHLMAEKRNRVIHLKDLLLARPYKETKKKRIGRYFKKCTDN